jgi:hypothetical protein
MQKPDQWNTSAKSGVEPGSKLITSRIVDLDPGDLQAEFHVQEGWRIQELFGNGM